jgi:hypothetical protein
MVLWMGYQPARLRLDHAAPHPHPPTASGGGGTTNIQYHTVLHTEYCNNSRGDSSGGGTRRCIAISSAMMDYYTAAPRYARVSPVLPNCG